MLCETELLSKKTTIPSLFEEQVNRTPDAIAVVFLNQQITYKELNKKSNKLAHYLVEIGVGPETRVGLYMERSLEMIISMLAILKAGGAYVPLDSTYPDQRLFFILQDAEIDIVVTHTSLSHRLPSEVKRVCPISDEENLSNLFDLNLGSHATSESLAYVIYTSGSTGTPKGVLIPHRGVERLVKDVSYVELSAKETLLQLASISFDAATFEIWGSLLNGAKLVVYPHKDLSLEELGQVLRNYQISTLWLTSGLFQQMVDYQIEDLKTVRQLLAGGDVLSSRHVRKALSILSETLIINGYGPTESTTFACCYSVENEREIQHSVPIGRPINSTEVYILNDKQKPVPIGIVGELYIGGKGLALGYLNRPELTLNKFINNPFNEFESKLFRTGDLVKYLPNGNIEYIGRIDNQVKIRGYRIELGEIEAVLGEYPEIKEVAVIAHEDEEGEKRLAAYIVGSGEVEEWKEYAKKQLPHYMIPSYFMRVENLPLTTNGKLDRKALPQPKILTKADQYVAPRNSSEELVASIWSEILKLDRISIYDSFFDLGGHSLLATLVISRLQGAFNLYVPLRALFECPTIDSLTKRLTELGQNGRTKVSLPDLCPVNREGELPLSYAQQRLWFLNQLEPNNAAYNIPYVWRLSGSWDVSGLTHGFNSLIQRHEMLRTVFPENDGEPIQVIKTFKLRMIPVVNLEDFTFEERETQINRHIELEAGTIFNLEAGPLIHAKLIVQEAGDYLLLCTMHHIISDGWSEDILLKEWLAFYEEAVSGEPNRLAPLPIQYGDFAVWQREWLTDEVIAEQLDYWENELAGELPVLQLPIDRPRPAIQSYAGDMQHLMLSTDLLERLKAFSRQEGTTLFMTLLAAYQGFLARYTGQKDIMVGSPIANRNKKEIEDLIGFFVNTLVYRGDLRKKPNFKELLAQVKEKALRGQENQDVPFEKIVEALQPSRNTSYSSIFQTMFTWIESETVSYISASGILEKIDTYHHVSKFDLTLSMGESNNNLFANIIYNTDLFDKSTIVKMMEHFENWLFQLSNNPDTSLSDLDLLSQDEHRKIVSDWNNTKVVIPTDKCLHDLFIEQVSKTPDLIAAELGDERITYRELDTQSNKMAQYLHSIGVRPNVPVGICMNRSIDLVISLLGILKAGGAFLPLDTEMPQKRISKLIKDSRTKICISHLEFKDRFSHNPDVICIYPEAIKERISAMPNILPESLVTPHDIVSIYYTSGSTGNPKGVENLHLGWTNRILWMQRQHQLEPGSSVLQKTTLTFDDAAVEFFWPLSVGGRISFLEPWLHRDPNAILEAAIKYEVSCIQFVPSMLNMFLDVLSAEDRQKLAGLKNVISSGEALLPEIVRKFYEKLDGTLHNTWGATEVSIDSTIYTCTPNDQNEKDSVSIGKPIDNNKIYILDENLKTVPVGVIGDLYIGGIGLARGYLHNIEKTKEVFIENPFCEGEKIYRTGDKGYFQASGNIKFVGRQDNQIKIRGIRVELGEIEATLSKHSSINEVAVVAIDNGNLNKELAAYIVGESDIGELREFIKEQLPIYMIPTYFVKLDIMPKTQSGKLDRKALPMPEINHIGSCVVEPRTIPEELIFNIWCDVLHMDSISVHDSFFDLGGHSLLATQVISRMRTVFEVDIPLRTIFEFTSIEKLASRISELRKGNSKSMPLKAVADIGGSILNPQIHELSNGQKRQWFYAKFNNQQAFGGIYLFELDGPINSLLLHKSMGIMIDHHRIMRTTIVEIEGQLFQQVHNDLSVPNDYIDLSTSSEIEIHQHLARDLKNTLDDPFDLFQDSFFRMVLYSMPHNKHFLTLCVHHIGFDGWSLEVFIKDLLETYQKLKNGKSLLELAKPLDYIDYTYWKNTRMLNGEMDKQREYWLEQLGQKVDIPKIPRDSELSHRDGFESDVKSLQLDKMFVTSLAELTRTSGGTTYITILAAINIWIALISDQTIVTVGSTLSARTQTELENIIGPLINPVAMRTDLSGNPSVLEIMQRTRETAYGAYENQDYPFDLVVQDQQVHNGHKNNLYSLVFIGQNTPATQLEFDEITYRQYPLTNFLDEVILREYESNHFIQDENTDLMIFLSNDPDKLILNTHYNTRSFTASTVDMFMKQLKQVLSNMIENPHQRLSQISLVEEYDLNELFN